MSCSRPYVGTDHAELGRLAAEAMVKDLKADGKTRREGRGGDRVAQQLNVQTRVAAFKGGAGRESGLELVAAEDGKWNTALTGGETPPASFSASGSMRAAASTATLPWRTTKRPARSKRSNSARPQGRRGEQRHRRGRQQLHEGRRAEHPLRQAVRTATQISPDGGGRGRGEEGGREFSGQKSRSTSWCRCTASPARTSISLPRLFVLSIDAHSRGRRSNQAVRPERSPQERQPGPRRGRIYGDLRRERRGPKSTLVKVITGVHLADAGAVLRRRQIGRIRDPQHARTSLASRWWRRLALLPHCRCSTTCWPARGSRCSTAARSSASGAHGAWKGRSRRFAARDAGRTAQHRQAAAYRACLAVAHAQRSRSSSRRANCDALRRRDRAPFTALRARRPKARPSSISPTGSARCSRFATA